MNGIPMDKVAHFLGGWGIFVYLFHFFGNVVGILVVIFVAFLKEAYDSQHPKYHIEDPADLWWTLLGGWIALFAVNIMRMII